MRRLAAWVLIVVSSAPIARADQDGAEAFFETKIRPILAGTCFKCHGGQKTSGGLRVDGREALVKGGENGPAVVPGDAVKSLLVQAIRHAHDEIKMPPGRRLPDAVVDDFAAWVNRGAVWPKKGGATKAFAAQTHWAFTPVRATQPPDDPTGWSQHPIDGFLAAKWREHHLTPAQPADKRTLIRRLTFDLTGLPPTPEEITAFLADESRDAYPRLVERLLASPRYGERWGRHWMDVARYADTAGDNADYPIPEARLYRDYVIDSFNKDKPYDRFVQEQLAGDLLAREASESSRDPELVIATGFLALSRRYATAPMELWHLTLEDTIETTGRAFLGLTLRCARCHDHKFDPVKTDDYYALYGIFASTQFPYAGSEEFASMGFPRAHFVALRRDERAQERLRTHERQVAALRAEIERLERESEPGQRFGALSSQIDELTRAVNELDAAHLGAAALKAQLARLHGRREEAKAQLPAVAKEQKAALRSLQRPGLPHGLPGAYAVTEGKPIDEAIHLKGDPSQRGRVVPRRAPAFLSRPERPAIPPGASGRLELARWITRPDNPLTARVMVNRIWQHHFGRGIVATPSNFGLRGEEPTHPELLDWLAERFVASGWSVKTLHRLIVSSRAYQMVSGDDTSTAGDPENRWLSRFERRRLDAESIRDAMLAVAGNLDASRPGAHPFPPIDQWGWTQHNPFTAVYPSNHRSVYLMTQRLKRHPFLALFDGPDTNSSTDVRSSSTVPLQALYLMNNPFVTEQAQGLARRLLEGPGDDRSRIARAYELAWGRMPATEEIDKSKGYLARYTEGLVQAGIPRGRVELEAWTSLARVMITANEFLYVD